MADPEPEPKLRILDEEPDRDAGEVVRLNSAEKGTGEPEVIRRPQPAEAAPRRLESEERSAFEGKSLQPGVEAILDQGPAVDSTESPWGSQENQKRAVPYGWFVLIILVMAGAGIWAFRNVTTGEKQVAERLAEVKEKDVDDAASEAEAREQVEMVESVIRRFYEARTVEELLPLIRFPERVGPWVREYVKTTPLVPEKVIGIVDFQPGIIEGRNIWLVRVRQEGNRSPMVAVELYDDGSARVDWETLVCHQPMAWDRFVLERPEGKAMNFRVWVEPDVHFSHEFADESRWHCYRLTTRNEEEYGFGYVEADSEAARLLESSCAQTGRATVILRLVVPPDSKAPRAAVIDEFVAPRWLYLNERLAEDGP